MKQWYKVIDKNGFSCCGGNYRWSLPKQDVDGNWIPGGWHNHDEEVLLGKLGFHITDNPLVWLADSKLLNYSRVVYECEISEYSVQSEYDPSYCKMAVSRLRLTKLVSGSVRHGNTQDGYDEVWLQDGMLHRDGLAALSCSDGGQEWYQNGVLHRDGDLPAVVKSHGDHEWYQNGKRNRGNDRPTVVKVDGTQEWHQNDRYHRENGPAIIYPDGVRAWYRFGKEYRWPIKTMDMKRPWDRQQ